MKLLSVCAVACLLSACSGSESIPVGPGPSAFVGDGSARVGTRSNRDLPAQGTVPVNVKVNRATTAEGKEKVEWSWNPNSHATRYEIKWERRENIRGAVTDDRWVLRGSVFAYDVYHDRYIAETGHYRSFVRAYVGNVPMGGWSEPAFFSVGAPDVSDPCEYIQADCGS